MTPEWAPEALNATEQLLGPGPWRSTRQPGTGGGGFGSIVVHYEAPDRSVIVKAIGRNDDGPRDQRWWRRELEVYRSEWLRHLLPSGLAIPRLLDTVETPDAVVLIMETVEFADHRRLDGDWYSTLAERLGVLNATPLAEGSAPPWASVGAVRQQTDEMLAGAASALAAPARAIADVVQAWRTRLGRMVSNADRVVATLGDLPTGWHHLDIFSRNAARVDDEFLLIDWAHTGLAPLGVDAAALVVITAVHGDVGTDVAPFADSALTAYERGVLGTGVEVDRAALGVALDLAITLRFSLFLTQISGVGAEVESIASGVSGYPFTEIVDSWHASVDAFAPRADRALAAIGA